MLWLAVLLVCFCNRQGLQLQLRQQHLWQALLQLQKPHLLLQPLLLPHLLVLSGHG
jgi:hypothetical protein